MNIKQSINTVIRFVEAFQYWLVALWFIGIPLVAMVLALCGYYSSAVVCLIITATLPVILIGRVIMEMMWDDIKDCWRDFKNSK